MTDPKTRLKSATAALGADVAALERPRIYGRLTRLTGPVARTDLTQARLGTLCELEREGGSAVAAEVAGFDNGETILAILGDTDGLAPDCKVYSTGEALTVPVSDALLGRVVGATGGPIDGRGPIADAVAHRLRSPRQSPMERPPIETTLVTGVRVIDGLTTLGQGQRLALFGPPGAGKSVLLSQIAVHAEADICVLALVGERGREVRELLDRYLSADKREKCVVVVATSDEWAGLRVAAGHTATAIAEYFRDQGRHVLLLFDSVTRFARALREFGLATGLPPTRQGFTPNVFVELPRLFERAGRTPAGAISAIYTTLIEGEGEDDPIREEVQSLLDGHLYLDAELARANRFPAVDVLRSKSRLMDRLVDEQHAASASELRAMLHGLDKTEFLVRVGEYTEGSDEHADKAMSARSEIEAFLCQRPDDFSPLESTKSQLRRLTT